MPFSYKTTQQYEWFARANNRARRYVFNFKNSNRKNSDERENGRRGFSRQRHNEISRTAKRKRTNEKTVLFLF